MRKNKAVKEAMKPKQLKAKMVYNGREYTLVKRSERVALYSIDKGRRWEVSRIYILPPVEFDNMFYPCREALSNGNQFGRDGSKFFTSEEQALGYFEKLNRSFEAAEQCEITVEEIRHSASEMRNNTNNDEKVSNNVLPEITSNEKTEGIFRLKETFRKNGYVYHIDERNDKVVLLRVMHGNTVASYEVCMIKILPSEEIFGKRYPKRETIPTDEEFGNEGSKSFFGNDYEFAKSFFHEKSATSEAY